MGRPREECPFGSAHSQVNGVVPLGYGFLGDSRPVAVGRVRGVFPPNTNGAGFHPCAVHESPEQAGLLYLLPHSAGGFGFQCGESLSDRPKINWGLGLEGVGYRGFDGLRVYLRGLVFQPFQASNPGFQAFTSDSRSIGGDMSRFDALLDAI